MTGDLPAYGLWLVVAVNAGIFIFTTILESLIPTRSTRHESQ